MFQDIVYQNKNRLSAGIIVAGWDKYKGGEVYSIPLGGSLHKQPFAIGGKITAQKEPFLQSFNFFFQIKTFLVA